MLPHRCQLSQHHDSAFRVSKRITIIPELDGFKGGLARSSKCSESREYLCGIDASESHLAPSRVAVPASKRTGHSDRNQDTLPLHLEQNLSMHEGFLPWTAIR